ncbi:trehalose transporter 1-like protein [Onthophagus taurus]|uniref:trehalose transporter 1-like protein n=1 Tax=Onthophagus taurus TaxID=166361 RepID=UPI000C203D44|nr:facilitated trehalose transporter Tret1-2 homolog [Onthophagus taurus]
MYDLKGKFLNGKMPQVITVLTATLGALSDGMNYGWPAPVLPILSKPDSPIPDVTHESAMWIELLYMLGGIAGLPITIFIVDKLGRKMSLLITAMMSLVVWIMTACATNVETIYAIRFISGMAGDMAFVAGPMYIAEVADKSIRGLLSGFIYLALLLGIVIIYSVAPFVSLVTSSCVGAAFVIVQLFTFSFMPESPYYLLMKGKDEKCRKALVFLRSTEDVDAELLELKTAIDRQIQEKGRPIDLLLDKGNRKGVIIMTVLNASQHFSSISVILMNLHTILEDAKGIVSPDWSGIVFSLVMLLSASVSITIVDKFGRKILLVFSSFLTAISLAILATYLLVKHQGGDVSNIGWVPLFSVLLYAVAFKSGLGMVPIVMTGELFPAKVKAMGMANADAMYVLFGALSIFIYQELVKNFGIFCPFYLFSCCCILTAIFAIFYIPETKGKTLEEIQYLLKGIPLSEMKKNPQEEITPNDLCTKL